jgi:hypothetical protein
VSAPLYRCAGASCPGPLDIAAIRARADAATPGLWEADCTEDAAIVRQPAVAFTMFSYEDARFIAAARADVPALCDELEAERANSERWAIGAAMGERAATSLRGLLEAARALILGLEREAERLRGIIRVSERETTLPPAPVMPLPRRTGPDALESRPDVASLARHAAACCATYADARREVLEAAAEGEAYDSALSYLTMQAMVLGGALVGVGRALGEDSDGGVWWARGKLSVRGVVDTDAWATELLLLAQGIGDAERTTEPSPAPQPVAACPDCGAPLPCYGRGLTRSDMETLALRDRAETQRRLRAHALAEVRRSPEGLTAAEIARRLGLDPTGIDDVAVLTPGPRS